MNRTRTFAGIGMLAIALSLAACGGSNNTSRTAATATATPPASASARPAATCTPGLTITNPKQDTHINGDRGLTIQGTACLRPQEGLLAFDKSDGSDYLVDDKAGFSVRPRSDGQSNWTYFSGTVGDEYTKNQVNVITFVIVTPPCSQQLKALRPDSGGDVWTKSIPESCLTYNAALTVIATRK